MEVSPDWVQRSKQEALLLQESTEGQLAPGGKRENMFMLQAYGVIQKMQGLIPSAVTYSI